MTTSTTTDEKQQTCFKLAVYNEDNRKFEFRIEDVMSEINQIIGSTDQKIVIATAVGKPRSGKTQALLDLLLWWNGCVAVDIPKPAEDHRGINLMLSVVPKVFGGEQMHLLCLDVVWELQNFEGYKESMEACHRISNLVTYTFCESYGPFELEDIKLGTECSSFQRYIAIFSECFFVGQETEYYAKQEDLAVELDDQSDEDIQFIAQIRKAAMSLAGLGQNVPVKFEISRWSYGRMSKEICLELINSLLEEQVRESINTSAQLNEVLKSLDASMDRQHGNPRVNTSHLRLRDASYLLDGDFQLEMAKLKLTASFRELAPKAVELLVSAGNNFSSVFASIQRFGDTEFELEPGALHEIQCLAGQLRRDLAECCTFFCSFASIIEDFYEEETCLEPSELAKLRAALRSSLQSTSNVLRQEKDFLTTICTGVLASIISTLCSWNEDVSRTEERLVKPASDAAFEAYSTMMDRLLDGKIWSERDIQRVHKQTAKTIKYSLPNDKYFMSRLERNLKPRMNSYLQTVTLRHAEELKIYRKSILDVFDVRRMDLDNFFNGSATFRTLAELKREGYLCLDASLNKLEALGQLAPAGIAEVRQMLRNYCYGMMLNSSSGLPQAAEVLAEKPHVTFITGDSFCKSVQIVVDNRPESISMDSRFWLENGIWVVMETHLSPRYVEMHNVGVRPWPFLNVNTVAHQNEFSYKFDRDHDNENEEIVEVIGNLGQEQTMALYFKAVKKYLFENYHLVPAEVTVVVNDSTGFFVKHRMDAAIRLGGLPPPKFMSHVGAMAAGFYRKNPGLNYAGMTLFVVADKNKILIQSAKCQLSNAVKVINFHSLGYRSPDQLAAYVSERRDNSIQSVVVLIHSEASASSEELEKKREELSYLIEMYHEQFVTNGDLLAFAAEGACFVNKYSEDVYYEVAQSRIEVVRIDLPFGDMRRTKTLSERNTLLENKVFLIDNVDYEPNIPRDGIHQLVVNIDNCRYSQVKFLFQVPPSGIFYTLSLWKDGILSKPEIRAKDTEELVHWEMQSELLPWDHEDFRNIRDPQVELANLAHIETVPIRLLKFIAEDIAAVKRELHERVEQIERDLVGTSASETVVEEIRCMLQRARRLVESAEPKVVEMEEIASDIRINSSILNQ